MDLEIAEASLIGTRQRNEDRVGHWSTGRALLMVLADGMGGHPHGDLAAQTAVETMSELFQRQAQPELPLPGDFLERAFREAHRALIEQARQWELEENHRTTLVAGLVQNGVLWWAHSGDSRLYLVRAGELVMRTRDHSFAELSEALSHEPGVLEEDVPANILFSCLGSTSRPLIDRGGPWSLMPGDQILLCSDGLWGPLSDLNILRGLQDDAMSLAVPALAQRALAAAGLRSDNITLLACQCKSSVPDRATPALASG